MAITWLKPLPRWGGETVEPPEGKKDIGWVAGDKPPAKWWNWYMKLMYEAVNEQGGVIESLDTQIEGLPTLAEVETAIDESLGGAQIRNNAGVIETLIGGTWVKLLKEGDSMIKSVQRGFTTVAGSLELSISPVNMSKAFVNVQPWNYTVGGIQDNGTGKATGRLTGSNTLLLHVTVSTERPVAWEVIEYM